MLDKIGQILSLASSAKSLFGGSGGSEESSLGKQLEYNIEAARRMPFFQVQGLKRAGLNPMLALGMGGHMPSTHPATISPGKDADISTAKALAAATTANQAAQAKLYNTQADKVEAETETEKQRPVNVMADTALKDQSMILTKIMHGTETENARLKAAMAGSEEVRLAVQKVVASPMAAEALKQATQSTQMGATSAKQAAAMEKALDKLPVELIAAIRVIQSIFRPSNPFNYVK